jgi:hypothetical protein
LLIKNFKVIEKNGDRVNSIQIYPDDEISLKPSDYFIQSSGDRKRYEIYLFGIDDSQLINQISDTIHFLISKQNNDHYQFNVSNHSLAFRSDLLQFPIDLYRDI